MLSTVRKWNRILINGSTNEKELEFKITSLTKKDLSPFNTTLRNRHSRIRIYFLIKWNYIYSLYKNRFLWNVLFKKQPKKIWWCRGKMSKDKTSKAIIFQPDIWNCFPDLFHIVVDWITLARSEFCILSEVLSSSSRYLSILSFCPFHVLSHRRFVFRRFVTQPFFQTKFTTV